MKSSQNLSKGDLRLLVNEYEATSQTGTVGFIEEPAFCQLIDYYESRRHYRKALSAADFGIGQHLLSVGLHLRKARLLILVRQANEAVPVLEKATSLAPRDNEVALLRAEALCAAGRPDEALKILDLLKPTAEPDFLTSIFRFEASIFENQEEHEAMFNSLKEVLLLDPFDEDSLAQMWMCVELTGKHAESITLHWQLIDIHPYNSPAWFNIGLACTGLEKWEDAVEAFNYAYIVKAGNEPAYFECADACITIGNFKKALDVYSDYLEVFPTSAEVLTRIGHCFCQLGKMDIAETYFWKAIALDTENAGAYFRLGECLFKNGRLKEALPYLRKAVSLEDGNEACLAVLGEVYMKMGETERAKDAFQQAAELAPDEPHYWRLLVSCFLQMGEVAEALETIQEAEEYGASTELTYCRICALLLSDQRKAGMKLLRSTLARDFSAHSFLFAVAPQLANDPEIAAAIACFRPSL